MDQKKLYAVTFYFNAIDIEGFGYDVETLSEATMDELARDLRRHNALIDAFWDAVAELAKELGLPKLED